MQESALALEIVADQRELELVVSDRDFLTAIIEG